MTKQQSNQPTVAPRLPAVLVLRWLLGLYLIGGCIFAAAGIISDWASIRYMMETDPSFNVYPMLLGWPLKLASGVLLVIRSRWLLAVIPAWIVVFLYDFLSRNAFHQLPPDFFFAVVMQLAILFFALWLHGRGRLK